MYCVEIFNSVDYVDGAFHTAADALTFVREHLTHQHTARVEYVLPYSTELLSVRSLAAQAAGEADGW